MKKLILLSVLSFMTSSAFAARAEIFKAVLNSSMVADVKDIEKVEVVAAYYCVDCFDFKVSGKNLRGGEKYVFVHTQQTSTGELSVSAIEGSR